LRNYPVSQPESLWDDPDLGEEARNASAFYQRFCKLQGAVGDSPDEAVRLWEEIQQSLRAKLQCAFRSRWFFWRPKWRAAEAEARSKAVGPLLEQKRAIEEGRQ
jgi:hypothetical protein